MYSYELEISRQGYTQADAVWPISPMALLYSADEIRQFFRVNPLASAQYDQTFLGFADMYCAAARCAPREMVVHDIGCCIGFQARYFVDFADYIGVDLPRHDEEIMGTVYPHDKNVWELGFDVPGHFVECEGRSYLEKLAETLDADGREQALILVSAVEKRDVAATAHSLFDNVLSWYPGQPVQGKGRFGSAMEAEFNRLAKLRASLERQART